MLESTVLVAKTNKILPLPGLAKMKPRTLHKLYNEFG
jgi:hypothetical protein